jgi:hypothetical protein
VTLGWVPKWKRVPVRNRSIPVESALCGGGQKTSFSDEEAAPEESVKTVEADSQDCRDRRRTTRRLKLRKMPHAAGPGFGLDTPVNRGKHALLHFDSRTNSKP